MGVITLTTDFGLQDWFVGTMKGVIWNIAPQAQIADITHAIPPGDIRGGAFALAASYRFFPRGTIHVAVVDPGVGSKRRAIAVKTRDYVFVGPDNGVLSFALRAEQIKSIHRLENKELFLKPISQTFHGRDIFAPVAAQLSRGTRVARLGKLQGAFEQLAWAECKQTSKGLQGEVIYVDRFGNAITNLPGARATSESTVILKRGRRIPCARFYQSVPAGSGAAITGSSELIEIAINGGSAAAVYRLSIGDPVILSSPK